MLGYVHAGIGDANNIFHGKPVYGKASHAKAAGNVLFLKHGISRYPQAQALGQYLRLFDSGFRHQDNEFVPAVASKSARVFITRTSCGVNASSLWLSTFSTPCNSSPSVIGMHKTACESGRTPCRRWSPVICTKAVSPVRATRPTMPVPRGILFPRTCAVMPA